MKSVRLADPATPLARALVAAATAAGCDATVTAIATRSWASATYVGAHHEVALAIRACVERYRWLASLAQADLPVRGHVALPPTILSADDGGVLLEVLTLESH